MNNPGTPTFDQLRIFLTIVDAGSFAAAGRKLNRAVSVVSYGIANLETQLGLPLFDRKGTKKPRLTVAGRALLAEIRSISHGIDGLRAKVKGLLDGLEAEVNLISPGAGRDYTQLVLTDRSRFTEGRDFSVSSPKTWRLADLGAKHALLREGIGWGNMPLPMIAADLVAGTLVRLAMPDHPGGMYRFSGIWRRDTPPGPAASWLLEQFGTLGREDREVEGMGDV